MVDSRADGRVDGWIDGSGDDREADAARALALIARARSPARLVARGRAWIDRVSLALPMALLLGGAFAFALFALPVRWPLGYGPAGLWPLLTALAGGCLAALPVWVLFRRLERPLRSDSRRAAPAAMVDAGTPTLRRADAHPDAPARRPIFAAADLGAPLDSIASRWEPAAEWGGGAPSAPSPGSTDPAGAAPLPDATAVAIAADASPGPPPPPREAADSGSAASLLARLDAALLARTSGPVSPGATGTVLRGALEELRRIGRHS